MSAVAASSSSSPPDSSSTAITKSRWAKKYEKQKRYQAQHNRDPAWFGHTKHILICSWSGRPIYSRYGDESKLAAYMGVITAIISNFQRIGDTIRSITAGDHTFVFLLMGPIYLIAISRTGESLDQLRSQLHHAHSQIVSVLTGSITQLLTDRPQYDIRNLMGGTESLLTDLLSSTDRDLGFLLTAIPCLRMSRTLRQRIGTVLRKSRTKSLLYAILLSGDRLVNVVRAKDRVLHPSDLLIVINFVTNSQSLRSSESWTPICLPQFSDKGFLYAYVCYLTDDLCLVLMTGDSSDFHPLRECKVQITAGLQTKGCWDELIKVCSQHSLRMEEIEGGIPDLRHFVYKSDVHSQYIIPHPSPAPYNTRRSQRSLFRRYQHLHSRTHGAQGIRKHTMYYEISDTCTQLAWFRPAEWELYLTFSPLVTKEHAMAAANRVIKWISKEETQLFIG